LTAWLFVALLGASVVAGLSTLFDP